MTKTTVNRPENAGYHACPCRDCGEIAIGCDGEGKPDLCNDCEDAGCSPDADRDCEVPDLRHDCEAAGCTLVVHARHWIIKTIKDHGPGAFYRYSVTGVNLYQNGAEFSWSVPTLDNDEYDLSNAITVGATS